MIADAAEKRQGTSHIRPFVLRRDLEGLATLIERAFGRELAVTGSQIVHEMRRMVPLGAMLWAASLFIQPFRGFVWMEGDRLVGNVTLAEEEDHPGIWTVSNVAVLPEFHGRGIAGQLVDTAIAYVRRHHGGRVLLQVRADNQPAQALYRHRGFVVFDIVHELGLAEGDWPISVGPTPVPLRPVGARDWRTLYRLVEATTPGGRFRSPIHPRCFRRGFWWRLSQRVQSTLGGPQRLELVGECEGEIVAYGHMSVQPSEACYEVTLNVAPGHRGRWELPLVEGLIGKVHPVRRRRLRARVSSSHPEALRALKELGFTMLRTLTEMGLVVV